MEDVNQKKIRQPAAAQVDPLQSLPGDSFARTMFIAYTTRIPWLPAGCAAVTRENEACYTRIAAKN
jgi:hypothetical protein